MSGIGIVILLCTLSACSNPDNVIISVNSKPYRFNMIEYGDNKGFIIPVEYSSFGTKYWKVPSDSIQHTSIKDISKVEKLISIFFKNNFNDILDSKISEYWRIYYPIDRDSNYNRTMRVILNCGKENMVSELSEVPDITDMGPCSISVNINLDSMRIIKVYIDMVGEFQYDGNHQKSTHEQSSPLFNVIKDYTNHLLENDSCKDTNNNSISYSDLPEGYPKILLKKYKGFIDIKQYDHPFSEEIEDSDKQNLHITDNDIIESEKIIKKELSKYFNKQNINLSDYWRFYTPNYIDNDTKSIGIYFIKGNCPPNLNCDPWRKRAFTITVDLKKNEVYCVFNTNNYPNDGD